MKKVIFSTALLSLFIIGICSAQIPANGRAFSESQSLDLNIGSFTSKVSTMNRIIEFISVDVKAPGAAPAVFTLPDALGNIYNIKIPVSAQKVWIYIPAGKTILVRTSAGQAPEIGVYIAGYEYPKPQTVAK